MMGLTHDKKAVSRNVWCKIRCFGIQKTSNFKKTGPSQILAGQIARWPTWISVVQIFQHLSLFQLSSRSFAWDIPYQLQIVSTWPKQFLRDVPSKICVSCFRGARHVEFLSDVMSKISLLAENSKSFGTNNPDGWHVRWQFGQPRSGGARLFDLLSSLEQIKWQAEFLLETSCKHSQSWILDRSNFWGMSQAELVFSWLFAGCLEQNLCLLV